MPQNMEAQGEKLPLASHDARRLLHVKLNTRPWVTAMADKYMHDMTCGSHRLRKRPTAISCRHQTVESSWQVTNTMAALPQESHLFNTVIALTNFGRRDVGVALSHRLKFRTTLLVVAIPIDTTGRADLAVPAEGGPNQRHLDG
jgi:hypothetical protein